jgi:hypothetical protein
MTQWRVVLGCEAYEVSNEGQVRRNGRILKTLKSKTGHLSVTLSTYPTKKQAGVHQLVLLAFVGPAPKGAEARHYPDRDPSNNRLSNLSWATRLVNVRDRIEHGTDNAGERHGMSRLTWNMVAMIRETGRTRSQQVIAEEFGVDQSTISYILNGKSWRE